MRNVSALALGLLFVGIGVFGASAGAPFVFPAAFDAQMRTASPPALFVMLVITEVCVMFGAWLVARIVTDHRVGHALMLAAAGIAVGVFTSAIRWSTAPAWYHVLSWVLMPVASYIGAKAWERTLRRHAAVATNQSAAT